MNEHSDFSSVPRAPLRLGELVVSHTARLRDYLGVRKCGTTVCIPGQLPLSKANP